jgi:hypothetical protein
LQGDGPSDKQKALVESFIERLGSDYPVPENVFTDRVACSAFIDKAMKEVPPSEKQIALARRLAEKLPDSEKPPESTFALAKKCSEFIDKQMKKSSAAKTSGATAGKGKPGASKPPVKKSAR